MTGPRPPGPGDPGDPGDVPAPAPDAADAALLRALTEAVARADPVPGGWQAAARAAGDWLVLDAEQAEVTYDSIDDVRAAGTAAGADRERRRVRYDAAGVTIDVELRLAADGLRLAGRVVPAGPCPVRALQPDGARATDANDAGAFQFDELRRAPVSLVVERDPAVKTGWIVP